MPISLSDTAMEHIVGATDQTEIGNVADALKVNVTNLPTGASTSANQTTEITALQLIDNPVGSVAPGTAGTNSFLAGGQYNTPAPTLTNTQQAALQLNASGALIVDASQANAISYINRTDVNAQVITTSGNTSTLDASGFMSLSNLINVTAISGSSASLQLHLQRSDDGTNWESIYDTLRITATGMQSWAAIKVSHRYYRYSWDVLGSTPSITLTVISTLKPACPSPPTRRRIFYADLSMTSTANRSTAFYAPDCTSVALSFQRAADGGNNGNVQIFGSIDGTNYYSLTANIAANVNTTNSATLFAQCWQYYQLGVVSATNAGTRVLDIQWSAN